MEHLSTSTGIPDHVLRLVVSLFASSGVAYLYRRLFVDGANKIYSHTEVWKQHLFSTAAGLSFAYFNYGVDCLHFPLIIVVSWLCLKLLGPTFHSAAFVFMWTFGYLMAGYYYHASGEYDLNWTTSYCVTCLRLIGFAMDYYDGRNSSSNKKEDSSNLKAKSVDFKVDVIKANWDNASLSRLPSLLETFGYCFFFPGFLVGPQFPFRMYEDFTTLKMFEQKDKPIKVPSGLAYASRCLMLGITYMAVMQLGKYFFSTDFIFTPEYQNMSFLSRILFCVVASRIVLYKYLGVWLVNETSCVISGISFRGYDGDEPKWDGLSNVDPAVFETVTSLNQVILSFNMNTNMWCKNYIFKRLKFLGSKELSGVGALVFLAVWHGYYPAYIATFLTEFLDMEAERRLKNWTAPFWRKVEGIKGTIGHVLRLALSALCYLLTNIFLSYGVITFDLLAMSKAWFFWKSVYFFSFFGVAAVIFVDMVMKKSNNKNRGKNEVKVSTKRKEE